MLTIKMFIEDGFLVVQLIRLHDQGDYVVSEDRLPLTELADAMSTRLS